MTESKAIEDEKIKLQARLKETKKAFEKAGHWLVHVPEYFCPHFQAHDTGICDLRPGLKCKKLTCPLLDESLNVYEM